MNFTTWNKQSVVKHLVKVASISVLALTTSITTFAAVELEKQYKVANNALFFNGNKVNGGAANNNNSNVYDYKFGRSISAHGDAIKVYKEFIFTTWYKGGKDKRNLMLSRYNTNTGVVKTIQFPHRHTGLNGEWWIGESHNTAAIGISPKDGKIHILYDMHSYNNNQFNNDYFRYSYTRINAATVSDDNFKLDLFVQDGPGDYGHVSLNGTADPSQFQDLTYPTFFLNEDNDLLFFMRTGGNNNGGYVFTRYNASNEKWDHMTQFNHVNAASKSANVNYNWGLYGEMKFVNGKLRTAFQTRSANNNDKYEYQNGIFYAYSDDQSGKSQWKNHKGIGFAIPFADPQPLKIFEPGNLVSATGKNEVYIVGGFDFTVTDRGDVHIISRVKDKKNNVMKHLHSYKPAGQTDFVHSADFSGAESLYTSGNNVYIIGLKNGRPFVQRTEGGKNSFSTLYEATSGQSFDHGVPHIYKGKLYYYLQEKGDSTALPVHVQIIDLDLGASDSDTQTGPAGYQFAANEGELVIVEGTMNVAFGAKGEFNFHYNQVSDLACSNAVFGDPIPGVVKKCYVQTVDANPTPPDDQYCSAANKNWADARATFAEKCSDFTRHSCQSVDVYGETWVMCSSLPNAAQYLSVLNSTAATLVQAEDYARAQDSTIGNTGGAYRAGDVDIATTNDGEPGYVVGWVANGEQLTYDLLVTEPGEYRINLRSSSVNSTGKFNVKVNGLTKVSNRVAPNTGNWGVFESTYFDLGYLPVGSQQLTFDIVNGGFNLNWFRLIKKASTEPTAPPTQTTCLTYSGSDKVELNLSQTQCVNLPANLSGKTLSVWDSDTNAQCDFRGSVTSVNGSGALNVTANYVTTTAMTGTVIKFNSNNQCSYVKMRVY